MLYVHINRDIVNLFIQFCFRTKIARKSKLKSKEIFIMRKLRKLMSTILVIMLLLGFISTPVSANTF